MAHLNEHRFTSIADPEPSEELEVADPARVERRLQDQAFRDDVVRSLWRIGGAACAGDLANELSQPVNAVELLPVLDRMAEEGPLRREPPDADPGDRESIYQTVYRIAR